MKYRRRDLIVDAFNPDVDPYPKWFELALEVGVVWKNKIGEIILNDNDYVADGDYIILGVLKEIWHIPAEEFEAYYEQIES